MKKINFRGKKMFLSLFFVFLIVFSFVFWGDKFFALAGVIIDSFADTSRVNDTWNITVATTSGEVKLATRTCDSASWICNSSNICSNDLGDGTYILVASTSVSVTKAWKTTTTACDIPQCGQDGGQIGDDLVADNTVSFSSYSARDACKQAGGRLPTLTELSCLYTNRAVFNNNFGTGNYWSSTESSATLARYVNFSSGGVYNFNKTSNNSVRCVLGW